MQVKHISLRITMTAINCIECLHGYSIVVAIIIKSKGKGTVHPRTDQEDPEGEQRYSSTLSLISELDGVGVQRHASAALPPGKTRYPFYRRLGGLHGKFGQVRKSHPHRDSIPVPSSS